MSILNRLKQALEGKRSVPEADVPKDERALIAAALLVEAALIDGEIDAREQQTVLEVIQRRFQIDADGAEQLWQEGLRHRQQARELSTLTAAVVRNFDEDERIALIELLWEVSYADGHLHDYEANLLRRVGGLIYVTDRDRGAAQRRVRARLGIGDADKA